MRTWTCLLCLILSAPAQAEDKAFTPDVNTLLLAHFDDDAGLRNADYALGLSDFAGNGARLTDGYYGKAIDLRVRPIDADFADTCSDVNPRYDGWGFHARGNVNPFQGTFECWFRPVDPRNPRLLWSNNFLNAELHYGVYHAERDRYVGFGLTLNSYAMKYFFPTVAGNYFEGDTAFAQVEGFNQRLDPEHWHHFAMVWDPGTMVVYLDGRAILSFDMTSQLGLLLTDNPVRYLNMSDCVVDELRISNVVRYYNDFEPRWRDGERPAYAFTGVQKLSQFEHRPIDMPEPTVVASADGAATHAAKLGRFSLAFDRADGALIGLAVDGDHAAPSRNGLMLRAGLKRTPLAATAMRNYRVRDGHARFEQAFDHDIIASHDISADGDALQWSVTLSNAGPSEAWLEALLGIPAPVANVEEIFDGCAIRRTVDVPRHRDEYCYTLPYAAASGGGRFIGVGADPHVNLNDIVTQWAPASGSGVLRQGTKVALSPGESWTVRFVIVAGEGDFGALDAIDGFHAQFPDLYRMLDDVPVYTYLPMTQYAYSDPYFDMKRLGYAGNFWGHGPGHDKGDGYGNPDWWDNPDLYGKREYERYTRRIENLWGSIEMLRRHITMYYRRSYDNWYPVRRYHTCPDVTPEYIINSLWPGYEPNEDPLCFGQYYYPTLGWKIVNEYDTPIGAWFREVTRRYYLQTLGYCNGFINDMSHAGSLYRHNDPIAQQTSGRSFSPDLGTFVRKAIGRRQRYEVLQGYVNDGHRMTFWSDGGSFSYTLGAFSAGLAIEGAGMYKDLTGSGNYVKSARYLLGEKPFSAMTHLNDDWLGYYTKADELPTPEALRTYYRYCGRQLVLWAIRHGVTLDASSYMFGRQAELEMAQAMIESTVLGRKLVPAARVDDPLWVVRGGNDIQTLWIVGNQQPQARTTDVRIFNRYFDGRPICAPSRGGAAEHELAADQTVIRQVTVGARDLVSLKAVAMLHSEGDARVRAALAGDGMTMTLSLRIDAASDGEVRLSRFAPMYEFADVTINGRRTVLIGDEPLPLARGVTEIEAKYRHEAFDFDAAQWNDVALIADGKTNFVLVADDGDMYRPDPEKPMHAFQIGFERGTANLLNDFVEQYDSEDGVPGNLDPAPFVDAREAGDPRWAVLLSFEPLLKGGRVRIDVASRTLTVAGPTQGEMRRAMVAMLRLVDRKYPHVGRFFPFRYRKHHFDPAEGVRLDKLVVRKPTREFFETFKQQDPLFLAKPILRAEYESLYDGGNMDFAGKYTMQTTCYLYEPTYGDDFVYGYAGRGEAESLEQLQRRATPQSP